MLYINHRENDVKDGSCHVSEVRNVCFSEDFKFFLRFKQTVTSLILRRHKGKKVSKLKRVDLL